MKIKIVFDLGREERLSISGRVSATGKPASYEDCKSWIEMSVMAELEAIVPIEFDEGQYV